MHVWADLITVDEAYLRYRGTFPEKRVRHVIDVFCELNSLPCTLVMREVLDVYLMGYWKFGERPCVGDQCALSAAQLGAWDRRFMVHSDALCWEKAIFVRYSRFDDRRSSV